MDDSLQLRIEIAAAADVRPMRREVLRIGMPDATVDFDGDDESTTIHLAAFDLHDAIVAVSTWMQRPLAEEPNGAAIQLRGMATKVGLQGTGVGTLLLGRGIRLARERNANVVWANARDSALGFYTRNGFEIIGDGFIEAVTGLAHHRVRFRL